MIKNARVLTKEESDSYFKKLNEKNRIAKEKSVDTIYSNVQKFIDAYHRVDNLFYESVNQKREKYKEDVEKWEKKICLLCGSKMHWIDINEGFWSCKNYKDTKLGRHTTYSKSHKVNPPYTGNSDAKRFLTIIIRELGFKGVVNNTDLYNFYQENELKCLYLKYMDGDMNNLLEARTIANRKSKEFEKKCTDELKLKFPKAIPQQGFWYETDTGKRGYCFSDIICSNDKEVIIYECKTNNYDKKESQKDLYIEIMEFLLKQNKDTRTLRFEYLIENED